MEQAKLKEKIIKEMIEQLQKISGTDSQCYF